MPVAPARANHFKARQHMPTLVPALPCLNDIRTMLPKILPDCNFNRSLSLFRDQNVSKSIPLKMTCNTSNSISLNLLSYEIDFKFLCWFGLAANNRTWSRKYYSDITYHTWLYLVLASVFPGPRISLYWSQACGQHRVSTRVAAFLVHVRDSSF